MQLAESAGRRAKTEAQATLDEANVKLAQASKMMMTAQDEVLQMKKKVDDYGALRKKLARLELKERIEVATKEHPQHGLPTRHA